MAGALRKRYGNAKPVTDVPSMGLDRRLLDILCCPVSKVPVLPLSRAQLADLNRRIAAGGVLSVGGAAIPTALADGLITRDGRVIYRVDDGIPVMLADEGIGTTQFDGFPGQ
jgi:uncharacterized protein YbaR (Trm112 family)